MFETARLANAWTVYTRRKQRRGGVAVFLRHLDGRRMALIVPARVAKQMPPGMSGGLNLGPKTRIVLPR